MNMGIIGRSIPRPNLANLDVTNIPITMIQRRFINLERLSTSSFSSEDFSCVWVLYGMVICGSITHLFVRSSDTFANRSLGWTGFSIKLSTGKKASSFSGEKFIPFF